MSDPRTRRDEQDERDPATGPANLVDETSEESFPASDAPSWSPGTRVGAPPHERDEGNERDDVGGAVDRPLDAGMDDRRA